MELKHVVEELSRINNEPEWLLSRRLRYLEEYNLKEFNKYFKHGLNIILTLKDFKFNESLIKNKSNIIIKSGNVIVKKINDSVKDLIFSSNINNDRFNLMHKAFCFNCNLILIPDNTETCVEINGDANFLHLVIVVGENSKAVIKENFKVKELMSYGVEVLCKENSKVEYLTKTIVNGYYFGNYKAEVGLNAEIKWLNSLSNGAFSRSVVETNLNDTNARVKTAILCSLDKRSQVEFYTISKHNEKNTYSDTLAKGVVKDDSKLLIRGLTRIEKNANYSDGYEKADILIFDNAEADAIPNLEIENSEVKCSHGATIGQIEKEKLFYLQSRGLNENEAKDLIVEGFFSSLFKFYAEDEQKIRTTSEFLSTPATTKTVDSKMEVIEC